MHRIYFCLLALFIVTGTLSYGQENLFTVLASKGDNRVKHLSQEQTLLLQTGSKIIKGDLVSLAPNGYMVLVNKAGGTVELKTAGNYEAEKLSGSLKTKNSHISKRITDFILSEGISSKNSKNMKYAGSITRANGETIDVDFPASTTLMDSSVRFGWYRNNDNTAYIFKLLNSSNTAVFLKETTDTSITINLEALNLRKAKDYKWLIYQSQNNNKSSDTSLIRVPSRYEFASLSDSLKLLESELDSSNGIVNNIILASFCESHNLNYKAMEYYEQVFNMNNDIKEFNQKYLHFLINHGLTRKAQIIYSKENSNKL